MSENSESYSFQGSPPRACPGEANSRLTSPGQASSADASDAAVVITEEEIQFPDSTSSPAPSSLQRTPGRDGDDARASAAVPTNIYIYIYIYRDVEKSTPSLGN